MIKRKIFSCDLNVNYFLIKAHLLLINILHSHAQSFFFLLPIDFDESKFVIDNKEGTFSIVCNIIMSDIVRARDFKEYFNRQQKYKKQRKNNKRKTIFLPTPATVTSCNVESDSRAGC